MKSNTFNIVFLLKDTGMSLTKEVGGTRHGHKWFLMKSQILFLFISKYKAVWKENLVIIG